MGKMLIRISDLISIILRGLMRYKTSKDSFNSLINNGKDRKLRTAANKLSPFNMLQ